MFSCALGADWTSENWKPSGFFLLLSSLNELINFRTVWMASVREEFIYEIWEIICFMLLTRKDCSFKLKLSYEYVLFCEE